MLGQFINGIVFKKRHPVLAIPVQNQVTGELGGVIRTFTSNKNTEMINRIRNNTLNLRTFVSWKMDLNRIFYNPSRGFDNVVFRFGRLVNIDEDLLKMRGYSDAEIANLKYKIGHPVVEVPVQNDFTGEEGNAIHSFTSRKRVPEMQEFEQRFDCSDKKQFLHNQGDVELEFSSKLRGIVQGNLNLAENIDEISGIFLKNSLLDRVNEHYLDWSLEVGDLPRLFQDDDYFN